MQEMADNFVIKSLINIAMIDQFWLVFRHDWLILVIAKFSVRQLDTFCRFGWGKTEGHAEFGIFTFLQKCIGVEYKK